MVMISSKRTFLKGFASTNILWAVLVIIILVVIGEIVGYFYLKKDKGQTIKAPFPAVTVIPKLTNEQIVEKVSDWLDKQRDDKGIYYSSRQCSAYPEKNCDEFTSGGNSGHAGLAALWARYKKYQKQKGEKDLKILLSDIDVYNNPEKIKYVQNDFWNCKLMFPIWKDVSIPQDYKNKIESICWSSGYQIIPELESVSGRGFTRIIVKKDIPDPVLSFSDSTMDSPDKLKNFERIIFYPSDFATRYIWKEDPEDLRIAKLYFNKSIPYFLSDPDSYHGREVCGVGISSLDLSIASGEKKYLDFAVEIYKRKIGNYSLLSEEQKLVYSDLVCLMFFQEINAKIPNTISKEEIKSFEENLFDNAVDYEGYERNLIGDGVLFNVEKDGKSGLLKSVMDNGLVVGIISENF